jgi:arginine/lysine/ornithine decarboxylase
LKKFLPYWNQPPIAICLHLDEDLHLDEYDLDIYSDEDDPAAEDFEKLVLFLCEYGGPLSHGTILYNEMKKYIDSCHYREVVPLLTELHGKYFYYQRNIIF